MAKYWSKKLILFICLSAIITLETQATDEQRYFIKFKPGSPMPSEPTINGFFIVEELPHINAQIWQLKDETYIGESEDLLQQLDNELDLACWESEHIIESATSHNIPEEFDSLTLWGLDKINIVDAWEHHQHKQDIIIAVLDTGVDYHHSDLALNMWQNSKEIPNNGIDDDENGYIDDVYGYDFVNDDNEPLDDHNGSHGTHVAGIIASVNNEAGIVGVNWNSAKIMALKVLSSDMTGTSTSVEKAIAYATQQGAHIINASLSTKTESECLKQRIAEAEEAGRLIVVAAGNQTQNMDSTPRFPASYKSNNIISVMATDQNDKRLDNSNWGEKSVDLGAPGDKIFSTIKQGNWGPLSGTSMATPFVTGVASLLWSDNPNLTYWQVREIILSSVDKIPSLEENTVTGGRLNAFNALTSPIPPARSLEVIEINITPIEQQCITASTTVGIAPLTVNFKGPDSIEQCIDITGETPHESCGEIADYNWQICEQIFGGCISPKLQSEKDFSRQFESTGIYNITLTAKDETCYQKEIVHEIKVKVLPELGQGFGVNKNGQFINTTTLFGGGSALNGEEYQKHLNVSNSLDHLVEVMGQIEVDPQHQGKPADILVVVWAEFPKESKYFMFNSPENIEDWTFGDFSALTAFQPEITLNAIQPVTMFKGSLVWPGTFHFYFGYRLLQDGTIVANSTTIDISVD